MSHKTKAPRRRGRPAEAATPRSSLLRVRLMPRELQLLAAAAAAGRTSIPRFARRVISAAARAALEAGAAAAPSRGEADPADRTVKRSADMDHEFELLKTQIAQRYGREPQTTREMGDALGMCDAELVGRVAARLEVKKCLSRPLLDFESFGGRRGPGMSAVPVAGASAPDEDAVDRAAQALAAASGKLLATSRNSVEAARRDFRRGAPLTKRRSTAEQMAADLEEIVQALNRPVEY